MKVYHSHRKAMFSICEAGDMTWVKSLGSTRKPVVPLSFGKWVPGKPRGMFFACLEMGNPKNPAWNLSPAESMKRLLLVRTFLEFQVAKNVRLEFLMNARPGQVFLFGLTIGWVQTKNLEQHSPHGCRQTLESSCDLEPTREPAWTVHVKSISDIPRFKTLDDSRNKSKCYPSGWDPVRSPTGDSPATKIQRDDSADQLDVRKRMVFNCLTKNYSEAKSRSLGSSSIFCTRLPKPMLVCTQPCLVWEWNL